MTDRDGMMHKARAFSDYARHTGHPPAMEAYLEMAGFLALFHPEIPLDQRVAMAREAGLEAFGDFAVLEHDLDRYLKRSRMGVFVLKPEMLKTTPTARD